MELFCDDCDTLIDDDELWREDEAGLHCQFCHEEYTAKSMAEAGIPPHSYRVNTNDGYDWGNYKNTVYMEEVLDAN